MDTIILCEVYYGDYLDVDICGVAPCIQIHNLIICCCKQ